MAYSKIIELLSGFILLFNLPSSIFYAPYIERIPLPAPGPEAYGFDSNGEGPYTGINDGRIVKYEGSEIGWVDYGYTSPSRTSALCDGVSNLTLGPICGRPLGLRFYYATGELYTADSYLGLCVVGPNGGLATQIADSAEGERFGSPDAVEVDQTTGVVYFTDASARFGLNASAQIYVTNDTTGRVIKYDPRTEEVSVVLRNLSGAAGVAISEDSSFLLVSEVVPRTVRKYWLTGPKANTIENFLNFAGSPNKIKRTKRGDFWVGVTIRTTEPHVLQGIRFNGSSGAILETLTFSPEFNATVMTEVEEFKDVLYLGSLDLNVTYVAVYHRDRMSAA